MRKKVTVVGAGNVGATTAQRLFERNYMDVVLVAVVEDMPQGKAPAIAASVPVVGIDATIPFEGKPIGRRTLENIVPPTGVDAPLGVRLPGDIEARITRTPLYPSDGLGHAMPLHVDGSHRRGEAGSRHVEGATVGLTHVIGLGSACGIHILQKVG